MNKEMQGKITRILYLLNEFDKGTVNLSKQAENLGFTSRTLQRDIKAIEGAGFPLYCPKPGLYAFEETFSLSKMKISDKEASLLVFMSESAIALGEDFAKSFSDLKNKFINMREDSAFFMKLPTGAQYNTSAITHTIERAINEKKLLSIYYTGGTKPGYYKVNPLKIAWYEGFWYLLGIGTQDVLFKLRLEQITKAKPLDITFKYTGNINKTLKESINIWFEEKRNIGVMLEVSKEIAGYFKNKEYFPLQKIKKENKDGSLRITCKAAKFAEITPIILHWLPNITVIAPKELGEDIKKKIALYLEKQNRH
jgi:predicted DNA-binding transcriptional regulator YafY